MKSAGLFFILLFCMVKVSAQKPDTTSVVKRIVPWYVERFKFSAAFFLPVNNTNVQVGVTGESAGTDINFQKDLGFTKDIGTFETSFQWRISSRSRLNLSYYDIRLSSTHTLQKDIQFAGSTYPINAVVNSFFNTAIYQFSYGYALVSKPRYELGILIGSHIVGGKVGLSNNDNSAGGNSSNNFGFTAPLPDLGVWGGYAFNNRLAMNLNVDYLSLTVETTSGSIFAYDIIFLYRLVNKLDLSLGYSGLNFKLNKQEKDLTGSLKWGYNGPSLGLTYSFGRRPWTN